MTADRVSVIGLGLIGGSMGGALRQAGSRVAGFDSSPGTATRALELGLIDEAHHTLADALAGSQMIILAIPVQAIVALLPSVDGASQSDALIVDTGSVKRPVVRAMASLPGSARAIGGHPIAGREHSGPEAADPELFRGRPFILSPSPFSSAAAQDRAEALARALGALPIVLSAEEHDEVLAGTSHLPQLLSTGLALFTRQSDALLSGPGLRDMTRLALSDTKMWRDILLTNRDNVVRSARGYIDRLEHLVNVIDAGDPTEVERALDEGRSASVALRVEALS